MSYGLTDSLDRERFCVVDVDKKAGRPEVSGAPPRERWGSGGLERRSGGWSGAEPPESSVPRALASFSGFREESGLGERCRRELRLSV